MDFTVYDVATGGIRRRGSAISADAALSQAGDGEAVLLGAALDDEAMAVVDGLPEPVTRPVDLDQLKAELKRRIDKEAGEVRSQFITTVPGQELVYAEKRAEAERVLAGFSNVPHLLAEAERDGMTLMEKAEQVLAMAAAWVSISAQIEDRRLAAKSAVQTAATAEEARSAALIDWTPILALSGT